MDVPAFLLTRQLIKYVVPFYSIELLINGQYNISKCYTSQYVMPAEEILVFFDAAAHLPLVISHYLVIFDSPVPVSASFSICYTPPPPTLHI